MAAQVIYAVVAALGALLQEVAHWHELKTKLEQARYKNLLSSKAYWVITALMIASSAVGTVVWFYDDPQKLRTYLLMGAAFPVVLKKAIGAFSSNAAKLGASAAADYFSIS